MADGPVKSHRLVGQCGDGRRYVDPRSEAGVSSRNRHSPELLPKGTSRRELAPRPRPLGRRSWQNYPVCSAREQLPADAENCLGRRTAGAREPVATQVASRVSGAHGPWLRRMGANRVSQAWGPGTWAGSSACAVRSSAREAATACRWLLSTRVVRKKQVTAVVTNLVVTNLVCGSNYIVRSICRGHLSLLSASPQYGGETNLATAKDRRKRGQNRGCAFTGHSKCALLLAIRMRALLKSPCFTAGKAVRLQ